MNNHPAPLISIIIPVYNTEAYLSKCLDSAVNQTYQNIEIIVVDDGSPGNCKEICSLYPKVKYFSYGKNRGLFYARSYGVSQALGEYILNLDSDDWLSLDACSYIAKAIAKEKCDLYMHACAKVLPNQNIIWPSIKEKKSDLFTLHTKDLYFIHRFLWQFTFRKDILQKIYQDLQLEDHFILSEDLLHFITYLYYSKSWGKVPQLCYYYNCCNIDNSATRALMTTLKAERDIKDMKTLFSSLEKFRKLKKLPEGIFKKIEDKQFMDRMGEMKVNYLSLDWGKLLPLYTIVFGNQRIAESLYDYRFSPSMKGWVKMMVSLLTHISNIIMPENSFLYNIMRKIWWFFKVRGMIK